MMFYLVRLDRDADNNLVETPLPDYGTFDKGADAAKASKAAAAATGAKVQCRRIAQAGDWRAAMQKRLESGELMLLPTKWDLPPIKDHFAHLAAIDTSKIGFIESEDHGIIQKVTVLTPGRYISRFYENDGKMDDGRRRTLIAAIDPSGEVFFATSPDDIEYVYRNGPESCMDGDHDFDDLPMWPTAPYGAGDLAIAYTKNSKGRIQSRTLCWPEMKVHGRCYGDIQRMRAAMAAEGYTDLREGSEGKVNPFIGARLMKVPYSRDDDRFVVPYFDDINVAIDMGDHFVTAQAGEEGQKWVCSGSSSSGTAYLMTLCPKLKVSVQARETRFVQGADQNWSTAAIRDHAFTCDGSGKTWSRDFKVIMGDGTSWSREWFAEHGEHCVYTHNNWPKSQMVQKGDQRMHRSIADRYGDDGKELAIMPRKRGRAKKEWVGDDYAASAFADQMIRPRDHLITSNDLILNRSRRVA
jgi:hypothetical protein